MLSKEIESMLENASGLLNIAERELSRRMHDGKECLDDQELYRLISASSSLTFEAYSKAQAINHQEKH